jgi:membrane-associated phospholipid phosphatase
MMAWDAAIPFWAGSILPYTSINLAFVLAFLWCPTERELNRLSIRLLCVQLVAFAFFWFYPLQAGRVRPAIDSQWGQVYQLLSQFDMPLNMLPSLHIGVLCVLWPVVRSRALGHWKKAADAWGFAVAISALTTWQHHLLDVAAGALLGLLVIFFTKR